MQKKIIQLPSGGELEIDVTPKFLSYVRHHFKIPEHDDVTDDDIRMFVHGSVKSALDNAESDPSWVVVDDS
ncbi:hypothetical protein CMI47_18925 [Candidatus Pacearchaeota archaeon]|nr:hypothetical protein [Candidatus Pacearchaeota archaeon]|tara:strand:+ start:22861 stop:23073 length:213 start_codon:yes stop_codon:yes gene_type:complete